MLSLLAVMGIVPVAYAQSPYDKYCNALNGACGEGWTFIIHLADRVATTLIIPVVGGIAVLAVIWAGFQMIYSSTSDQSKENAKKIILFAIAGLVLAALSIAIVKFVCVAVQTASGASGLCGI